MPVDTFHWSSAARLVSAAPGMPGAAVATGCVDFVLPLPVLAHALVGLVMVPGAANLMRVALPSWATAIPPVPTVPPAQAVPPAQVG